MDEVKENIEKVLNGSLDRWSSAETHIPVRDLVEMTKKIEGVEEGDFETNGWQWDWWACFSYKEKSYTMSGSGYYGGLSFTLDQS